MILGPKICERNDVDLVAVWLVEKNELNNFVLLIVAVYMYLVFFL